MILIANKMRAAHFKTEVEALAHATPISGVVEKVYTFIFPTYIVKVGALYLYVD